MPRAILEEARIHPAVRETIAKHHAGIVDEVWAAALAHPVLVVGMMGNPFPVKASRALDAIGVAHHKLSYGSYLSQWRRRNALKMWTGWPTFPMIFVRGQFVGGAQDLQRLIDNGELKTLLG
ncbi:MAG: glutaredoxin [Vitreoscilla sp.]|nr:glutaredoxin [Burkholderiales bacterium]MBP6339355.1 glutaredoxin [Vitreoscilla sp.]MBP6676748.1 glutaredoxin [Vitreoscilla sp.]